MTRKAIIAALLATVVSAGAAHAKDIRIGLNEDPDSLDPVRSRTFVSSAGRPQATCHREVPPHEHLISMRLSQAVLPHFNEDPGDSCFGESADNFKLFFISLIL